MSQNEVVMREIDEKKSDESDKGRDLLDAVVKNQFDCAEALLISGAPLDSKDSTSIYQTPLDWAVLHKNPKMIKLLMEHKAIPISPVIQPIVKAAEEGYWDCVKVIAENYKDNDGKAGYTKVLIRAIYENIRDILGLLILQNAKLEHENVYETPIVKAAHVNLWGCVIVIAENHQDNTGKAGFSMALFIAAKQNQHHAIMALLTGKADPNRYFYEDGRFHYSALHCAVDWRNTEMIKMLLAHGADPNNKYEKDDPTPLELAKANKKIPADMITLLENPPNPTLRQALPHLIKKMDQLGPFTPERLEIAIEQLLSQINIKNQADDCLYRQDKKIILMFFLNQYLEWVGNFVDAYHKPRLTWRSEKSKAFVADLEKTLRETKKASSNPRTIAPLQDKIDVFARACLASKKRKKCTGLRLLEKHGLFKTHHHNADSNIELPEIKREMS